MTNQSTSLFICFYCTVSHTTLVGCVKPKETRWKSRRGSQKERRESVVTVKQNSASSRTVRARVRVSVLNSRRMTLERHSVYLVPPRSSISSSSIAVDGGGKHGGERGGASQEKDGQNGTGNGSVAEASPPTVVKLRILNAAASTSTSKKATTTHRRKSHFVSWKMSAPSISTIGTQRYALSTEFPALLPPSSSSSIASDNGNGRRSSYATTASSNDAAAAAGSGGALSQYSTRVLNPATCPHKQRQQQVQPAASSSSPSKEASAANTPPRMQRSRSPSRQRVATERTDSSATTVNLRSDASTSSNSATSSPVVRSISNASSLSGTSGRNSVPPSPAAATTSSCCSCQSRVAAANGISTHSDTGATAARQALSRSSSFAHSEASSHFPPYNGSIVSSKAGDEDLRISLGRPYEREYESIIVANAVQPAGASAARKNGATDRQQQNYMNSGSSVPILRDTPGLLLGKHEEEDVFAVTRTNSVLMRRKDLQWYLDKMLWKLGVHKKARRDFMAVSIRRRGRSFLSSSFLFFLLHSHWGSVY